MSYYLYVVRTRHKAVYYVTLLFWFAYRLMPTTLARYSTLNARVKYKNALSAHFFSPVNHGVARPKPFKITDAIQRIRDQYLMSDTWHRLPSPHEITSLLHAPRIKKEKLGTCISGLSICESEYYNNIAHD
jgi:hypothetical protein